MSDLADDIFAAKRHLACVQQLERAQRAFVRFETVRTGKRGSDRFDYVEIEDALWGFFQNCWHVKDWAKHDPGLPDSVRATVVNAAHADTTLMFVRALANGSKHLDIETETKKAKAKDSGIIFDEPSGGVIVLDFAIRREDGQVERASELGRRALVVWRELLDRAGVGTQGLKVPDAAT
jgi:hypothetical protein